MAGSSTKSWWQYSRWCYVVSRVLQSQLPDLYTKGDMNTIVTTVRSVLKTFYDPDTGTGTRPWLASRYEQKSGIAYDSNGTPKPGDPDNEPVYNLCKILSVVARDLKKIPMTDAEATQIDSVFTNSQNAKYGGSPWYGNLI